MTFVKGVGLGAGLMYLFDPDRGRRRAHVRDQAVHVLTELGAAIEAASRDLGNRAYGRVAELRALLSADPVSDATLTARIRARMGHVLSHPRAVHVHVK
jgi:hypothetical protein